MSIEQQAAKVRKVKRAESGMIIDPVNALNFYVADAKKCYERIRYWNFGDENQKLKVVTNRICVLRR
jgi:IMP dehydrogenase